jgi:hypothetical protein
VKNGRHGGSRRRFLGTAFLAACLGARGWQAMAQQQPVRKPRVPSGRDPGGVAVAIIGSGVNYLLPEIAGRLARDGEGEMIGLDLEDGTLVPFEPADAKEPDGASRPGTALAREILREAPRCRLVLVRLKASDPLAPARAASFVASGPARIVAVDVSGSDTAADWETFRQAALMSPGLLFMLAAGDGARNLDAQPLYPHGFALDNIMVITAGDDTGQPLAGSSYGARTVDVVITIPAAAVDPHERTAEISPSRAALARAVALAARTSAALPELRGAALKAQLIAFAVPPDTATPVSRAGIIRDATRINAGK